MRCENIIEFSRPKWQQARRKPIPGISFYTMAFPHEYDRLAASRSIITQLDQATRYPTCCCFPFLNPCWTGVFSLWDLG
jgi:hypothetical protein